ncbi:PREDICTED: superkiller viralicidic activity 2-like 2 isoform X1 [Branchiostoma belcheri]|uniref:Exosome RNA helicase MTR4 n=1 Tax=Branchiostoma belcheri TaxID=7741 RepID=A0A6P4YTC9_BRABE|nr:PREDICTED: superkiller viralicidic activity 2-like 2 isoform X1 [Branchiostoma belcheri]
MAAFGDADELFGVFEEKEASPPKPGPSKEEGKTQKKGKYPDKASKSKRSITQEEEEDAGSKKPKTVSISVLSEPLNTEALSQAELDLLPKIRTETVDTEQACTHEVAYPEDCKYEPVKELSTTPAKVYPFVLDPFQKEALRCLESNQSVLVSAHTSAGKTVVAEYAIAMSLRDKQRVIYTTPIKALSNQKYRELYEEFQDVGLMTGDVTINPTASCLVMTTEILRSMLYRGSELMREVAWVVFDEIHYMRDKERGVVWEETIILLPDNVHYVFLSATIPNARQFAEWICWLHKQPCHVVYTDYRPVPLQHYIFPAGGDGLHLVVDETGTFREDNFNTAMAVLRDGGDNSKGDRWSKRGFTKGPSNAFKIVKMIMERNFAPVIAFSFSKKECEAYALQMSKLDFNTDEEKKLVEEVFFNAIDCLSDEDKKLPQVEHVLPLLKRGIGIHHGGLLPILKETIEILFSEGLIKALFATETFSMGLNMPARTVLFTSARKFDGKDFRWVSSGEYIQMSGRAGRRGLDERGIVILMIDEKMGPSVGKNLLKGAPDPLNSAFHLTYNMVLNLLRVEEINPEFMLEKSFYQYQNYSSIPGMITKLQKLQEDYNAMTIPEEDSITAYYKLRQQLDKHGQEIEGFIHKPKYCLPFLQPGRLVKVRNAEDDFGWGVVINFQKKANQKAPNNSSAEPLYVAEVLLLCSKESVRNASTESAKPCRAGEKGEMVVVPIMLHLIRSISSVRLYIPKDLRPPDNRESVLKSIQEVQRRFPHGVPLLDPIEDLGIKDDQLKTTVRKIEAFEHRMYSHPLHSDQRLPELYSLVEKKAQLAGELKAAKREVKKARTIIQMDELKCRKRVLRRLGYATTADVIEMKGRVACEISSADELLLTEMIFNGVFNDLDAHQCVALLSVFVFQEKASEMPRLTEELAGPLRQMQESARRIAKVSAEAKMSIEEEEYVESFRPHMMDVCHAWSKGATFAQICKMTDIFEGSIIRCMRRLEELMREMCHAAKAIGNTELENKFADGITKIKRDIVFAASLYL